MVVVGLFVSFFLFLSSLYNYLFMYILFFIPSLFISSYFTSYFCFILPSPSSHTYSPIQPFTHSLTHPFLTSCYSSLYTIPSLIPSLILLLSPHLPQPFTHSLILLTHLIPLLLGGSDPIHEYIKFILILVPHGL